MADTDRAKRIQQVLDNCLRRRAAGEASPDADVIASHPELMPELEERLAALELIEKAGQHTGEADGPSSQSEAHIRGHCPHCGTRWRMRRVHAGRRAKCRKCGQAFVADDGSQEAGVSGAVSPSASTPSNIPGYEIESELGHGGMGVVYRARELATKRTVALKMMLEGRYADERLRSRFEREVEIAASLRHPNIARLYASGLHEGYTWFAMEYVEGQPLDSYVEREHLDIRGTLRLFVRICNAINHAHQRGIMHRDLKPGNILVDERNQPHVLDFGLAKLLDRSATHEAAAPHGGRDATPDVPSAEVKDNLSMPGQVMGTPAYMSPEQTEGDPTTIDVRTDVYSLGVILYRLLTSHSPYDEPQASARTAAPDEGGLRELLRAINEVEPAPPRRLRREIPDDVSAIVLKSLKKDPAQRYQTAGELGRDIEAHLVGHPVSAKQGSAAYMLRKTAMRYRAPAATVAGVTVLSAALGLTLWVWNTETKTELKEVLSEREVLVERQSSADEAARAELTSSEDRVNSLRWRLDREQRTASRSEAEITVLSARQSGSEFNPPPPNPADPVNYIEWMNNTFGLENAADDYKVAYEQLRPIEKGSALASALNDAAGGPWSDNRELSDWLASNRAALNRFRQASEKGQCFFPPVQSPDFRNADPRMQPLLMDLQLHGLSEHRVLSKALIAKGWERWQDGDERALVDNALTVLRSARHLRGPAPVISHLVANACARPAYESLRKALNVSPNPDKLAASASPLLAQADPTPPSIALAFELERLWNLDALQRFFEPGEQPGMWKVYPPMISILPKPIPGVFSTEYVKDIQRQLAAKAVAYPSTVGEVNAWFDALKETIDLQGEPLVAECAELDRRIEEVKKRNPLASVLLPSLSRSVVLHTRNIAERRATHLVVCLFAYHAANGRFPRTLDELDAPDLAELRIDPFSGKDFVYKRTGEDFTLYSVAENFKDDGGRHHPKWGEQSGNTVTIHGDYVFWPVQVDRVGLGIPRPEWDLVRFDFNQASGNRLSLRAGPFSVDTSGGRLRLAKKASASGVNRADLYCSYILDEDFEVTVDFELFEFPHPSEFNNEMKLTMSSGQTLFSIGRQKGLLDEPGVHIGPIDGYMVWNNRDDVIAAIPTSRDRSGKLRITRSDDMWSFWYMGEDNREFTLVESRKGPTAPAAITLQLFNNETGDALDAAFDNLVMYAERIQWP